MVQRAPPACFLGYVDLQDGSNEKQETGLSPMTAVWDRAQTRAILETGLRSTGWLPYGIWTLTDDGS